MPFRNREGSSRGGDRKGRSGGFQYKPRTPEQIRRRQEQGSGGESFLKGDHPRYSPNKGENVIRILPPTWDGADHFGLDIHVHYGIGADNAAFLCPKRMRNEPCPVCEERAEADAQGEEEYARKLAPSHRVLYWLIDRDDEKAGPKIWAAPYKSVDREISAQVRDSRTNAVLDIDDPEHGYDIEFSKEGEKDRTKYVGVRVSRHESDLGRGADEWLDFVAENPLPDLLSFRDYDYIADAFKGGSRAAREVEEEEDQRPSSRRDADSDQPDLPSVKDIEAMTVEELEELAEELDIKNLPEDDDEAYDFVIEAVGEMRKERHKRSAPAAPSRRASRRDVEEEPEEEADTRSRMDRMRAGRDQIPSRPSRRR